MGCCSDSESSKPVSDFKPASERSCTDTLCFLIFVASWVGLIILIAVAANNGGNPYRIMHGADYKDRICGTDKGVTDTPYAAWPYVPSSINGVVSNDCADCVTLFVCLHSCNETQTSSKMTVHYQSEQFLYYCIPTVGASILHPASSSPTVNSTTSAPTSGPLVSLTFGSTFESASGQASRAMNALLTTWPIILASAFVALILAFIYAWLSRFITGPMVLLAILLVLGGGIVCSIVLLRAAADAQNSNLSERANAMKGVGYTVVALTVIFLCVMLFLRKRILLAIEVVKEASHAVGDMKSMFLFPIFPFVSGLIYFSFWIATVIFFFSTTQESTAPIPSVALNCDDGLKDCELATVTSGNYTKNSLNSNAQPALAYAFFHLLWVIQFLVYFSFTVLAGAVGQWYFTSFEPGTENKKRGENKNELPNSPVSASAYRTLRYHLGTIAFGSLIIAIIQFVRAVINYIERQTHAKSGGVMNRLQRAVFCLIRCCLWCVECCCDKISRNALVWTAVYGDAFIPAACASFQLVWANLARTAALTIVTKYIIFLGKLMVALVSTGLCGFIAVKVYGSQISSPIMPMVVMFLLSYLVASYFMTLYETTIDTLFLCFLIDENSHGTDNLMFAPRSLREVVSKHAPASAAEADGERALVRSRSQHINTADQHEKMDEKPQNSAPANYT